MFNRPFIGMRKSKLAVLLVSMIVSIDAAADSGDYRVRDKTLSTGVHVVQRVDTTVFPQFQGERPSPSRNDTPSVDSGHLRAVRALLPKRSKDHFVPALPDGSSYLAVDFYNHHVVLTSSPA